MTYKSVRVMVFHTTFNNISVLSRQSVLLVEETGVPGENHQRLLPTKLYHIMYQMMNKLDQHPSYACDKIKAHTDLCSEKDVDFIAINRS